MYLDISQEDVVPGILIESVEQDELDEYFDLAKKSVAMGELEKELKTYGVEINYGEGCATDVYHIKDFTKLYSGTRVDFTVQTRCMEGRLSSWWSEDKQKPVLDVRMYFTDGEDEPRGFVYLTSYEGVILEYEFVAGGELIENVFAPGGKEGYLDKSDLEDFFDLLQIC